MSKLEELIQKYCPDGVEYVKLGDIEGQGYIKLGRGNVISKQDMKDCPGDFPVYSSSSVGDGEIGRYGKYMFDDETYALSSTVQTISDAIVYKTGITSESAKINTSDYNETAGATGTDGIKKSTDTQQSVTN